MPKNVLVGGLSLHTLFSPLQSGVAYRTEVSVGKLYDIVCQGLCTGSDRSIFSLADILWGSGNADVSSPLVWLFLLLLDHSIKTHSSSGSGRGRLPHTIFSAEL